MKRYLYFILIALAILAPNCSFALEQNYPKVPFLNKSLNDIADLNNSGGLAVLVEYIYYFMIYISGFAALIMIIIGGVQYMTSAGNPSKMSDAKDKILKALLGLIIIFSSYLILNTIDPNFTNLTIREPETPKILTINDTNLLENFTFITQNGTNNINISPGENNLTLTWSALNFTDCKLDNTNYPGASWSGEVDNAGEKNLSLNQAGVFTFSIECFVDIQDDNSMNGTYNYASKKSVIITVGTPSNTPPTQAKLMVLLSDGTWSDGPVDSNKLPSYSPILNKDNVNFKWTSDADSCIGSCSGLNCDWNRDPYSANDEDSFSNLVGYGELVDAGVYNNLESGSITPITFTITCVNTSGSVKDDLIINLKK